MLAHVDVEDQKLAVIHDHQLLVAVVCLVIQRSAQGAEMDIKWVCVAYVFAEFDAVTLCMPMSAALCIT